jgi:acyl-CoA synthetase (NDP forming)
MTDDKKDVFRFEIVEDIVEGGVKGVIVCSHGFRKITSVDAAKECVRSWNEKLKKAKK